MSLADSVTKMTLEKVHPGGYFWKVARSDRDQLVRRLATRGRRLSVIAHSALEAKQFAERLTLSGLPVLLAVDPSRTELVAAESDSITCNIVVTHEFAVGNGPLEVSLAVHLRPASSIRDYSRRVSAVQAAAHISFVTPEDESRAATLLASLTRDQVGEDVIDVTLEEVIDLTDRDSEVVASIANSRRRGRSSRRNQR